jgi:Zn-dependent M16 (insulinase) family peptidase
MEGWSTSTAVSFVAQTFQTVRLDHADSPALSVIAKMLRSMYLHREIREKGGAYGGFALYNAEDGLFSFGSYRDPHIVGTLKVYNAGAADFIRSGKFSEEDVKEAILQVCSEIDKPDPPGPAARKAFYRRIIGLTDETRMRNKENLLKLTRKAVMDAADRYFDNSHANKAVAVISSRDLLDTANGKLAGRHLSFIRYSHGGQPATAGCRLFRFGHHLYQEKHAQWVVRPCGCGRHGLRYGCAYR